MKRIALSLLLLSAIALADNSPVAPGTTQVQQAGSRNDAATQCLTAQGTAQQTITIPAVGGQFAYITALLSQASAATAPAASTITTTTTNLYSTQLIFGLTNTAGISGQASLPITTPVKTALSGTATTVVSQAAITNVTYNLVVCWYYAP